MSQSRVLAACAAVVVSIVALVAHADEPGARAELARLEDAVADGEADGEELASFRYARPSPLVGPRSSAYVALEGFGGTHRDGSHEVGALVVVQLPLSALTRGKPSSPHAERASLSASATVAAPSATVAAPSAAGLDPPRVRPAASLGALRHEARAGSAAEPTAGLELTLDVARSCVRAAWRAVGVADDARIDGLATRARWSAALPELRVRFMRSIDQSGRVSLTGEELPRYTEAGGASNWLEARLSFRLDRLLFADEEIALERLRADRAELRARTAAKALQALFEWQRAFALGSDVALSAEEHASAISREVEAAAVLDVMTDGWFARFRAGLVEAQL